MSSQATHRFNTLTPSFERSLTVERSFMLFRLLPRSRGNSINYTSVSFAMQIRFPWFAPQSFFPKLLQHHQPATRISFKQETKTLYNWKSFNRLWLGETPKKTLRFFLLAAATHTTIQMPKWVCNPKWGEVDHKYGGLGSFWPEQGTKTPSQHRIWASKVLRKKFKKPHKNLENLQMLPEQPISRSRRQEETEKGGRPLTGTPSSLKLQSAAR